MIRVIISTQVKCLLVSAGWGVAFLVEQWMQMKPIADDTLLDAGVSKRGRKTVWFEKCSWAEVSAHPQALPLVNRLLLTANSFHSQ